MRVKDLIEYMEPEDAIVFYEKENAESWRDFKVLPDDEAEREAFLTRKVVKIRPGEIFDTKGKLGGRVSLFTALCVVVD